MKIDLDDLLEILRQEMEDVQTSLEIISGCEESITKQHSAIFLETYRSLDRLKRIAETLYNRSKNDV